MFQVEQVLTLAVIREQKGLSLNQSQLRDPELLTLLRLQHTLRPVGAAGGLDMDRLALVGHSFGGVTVGTAAAGDPHPLAAVALDPWW